MVLLQLLSIHDTTVGVTNLGVMLLWFLPCPKTVDSPNTVLQKNHRRYSALPNKHTIMLINFCKIGSVAVNYRYRRYKIDMKISIFSPRLWPHGLRCTLSPSENKGNLAGRGQRTRQLNGLASTGTPSLVTRCVVQTI